MDEIKDVTDKKLSKYFSIFVEREWELGDSCWQMANIAENKIEKMMTNNEIVEKLQNYSEHSWIRVYPFGLRFGSSNFNPLPFMKCGAQLISLNTQNYDINYTALKSHFLSNFNCGYELKPKEIIAKKQKKVEMK